MTSSVSVAIVGGGPAGALTALLLARANIDVTLFERSAAPRPDHGEVLAAEGRALLSRLDLWEHRPPQAFSPCDSTRASWRSAVAAARYSITNPYGSAWNVDRAALDPWLRAEAASHGAQLRCPASVNNIIREGRRWNLDVASSPGERVLASVVVDAGGRSPRRHHWAGAVRTRHDSLCAVVASASPSPEASGLLVEAVPNGWCYSVAAARGAETIAAFVTDADLLVAGGRGEGALRAALANAPLTSARVTSISITTTVPTFTASLEPLAGDGWLAVGDAALAHDPLAGGGLLFAFRTAIACARAIENYLAGKSHALIQYAADSRDEVERYFAARQDVYRGQPRWGEQPFWARRSAPAQVT